MKAAQRIPAPPALFYGVAVAALMGEVSAVLSIIVFPHLLAPLWLHLYAVTLTGIWMDYARTHYRNERFSVFLLPLTFAAGPFGPATCLIAAVVHALYRPHAVNPSEWIEKLFEREKDRETDRLHERITFGLDDFEAAANVEPFRDILAGGTVLQKQMAAAKIARYFRPQFAPLLLQAANDHNAAVRVQAATALAKIERDFMARFIKLENALKNLADNNPKKIKLAELYDDYAHAGLLDEANREALRLKAIEIYQSCLEQQDNTEWRIRLARLYLRQNQPKDAHRWLKPLVTGENKSPRALYWYMEALFCLKKFGELRALAEANNGVDLSSKIPDTTLPLDEIEMLPSAWQVRAANT